MAIGFPPKYQQKTSLDSLAPYQYFGLVALAFGELGWEPRQINGTTWQAATGFSWTSWGETITVVVQEDYAVFESKSAGQLLDYGRNRRNVQDLLAALTRVREATPLEDLPPPPPSPEPAPPEVPPFHPVLESGGFLRLFIPRRGYVVTPVILLLNGLVFAIMALSGVHLFDPSVESMLDWGGNYSPYVFGGEWWRLFTSLFLHIGIFHLLLNLYALLFVGPTLEPLVGSRRFLVAYLLAGLASSLASVVYHDNVVSAGASGAIFGLYGLFIALLLFNHIDRKLNRSLLVSMLLFVGYNLLYALDSENQIDNAAHLGGLLSGFVMGVALLPSLKRPQNIRLTNGTLISLSLALLLSMLFLLRTTNSDLLLYQQKMGKYGILEEAALKAYSHTIGHSYLQEEELFQRGITRWEESMILLQTIDSLDLEQPLLARNQLMKKYTQLRLQIFRLEYERLQHPELDRSEIEKYEEELRAIWLQLEEHP